jgi:hypothetical protein
MSATVLLGKADQIIEIPRRMWEGHVSDTPGHMKDNLAFMGADHHRVRYFVVDQLVRRGEALPQEYISESLELPLDRVRSILDDLETNLFFLVRDDVGSVVWAFPVTVEQTPHKLTFDSGESLYGA